MKGERAVSRALMDRLSVEDSVFTSCGRFSELSDPPKPSHRSKLRLRGPGLKCAGVM